jgi:hypothetical protein
MVCPNHRRLWSNAASPPPLLRSHATGLPPSPPPSARRARPLPFTPHRRNRLKGTGHHHCPPPFSSTWRVVQGARASVLNFVDSSTYHSSCQSPCLALARVGPSSRQRRKGFFRDPGVQRLRSRLFLMGGWQLALPCPGIASTIALFCRGCRGSVGWRFVVYEGALVGGGSIGVLGGLVGATAAAPVVGGIRHCKVAKVVILAGAESLFPPSVAPMVEGTESDNVYPSKV